MDLLATMPKLSLSHSVICLIYQMCNLHLNPKQNGKINLEIESKIEIAKTGKKLLFTVIRTLHDLYENSTLQKMHIIITSHDCKICRNAIVPAISCSRSSSMLGSKSLPRTSVLQVSLTVSEMSLSSVSPIMSRISNLRSLSSKLSCVVAT